MTTFLPPAPDPCDPNPCENDGKCTGTGDGGYSCECYPDFTGKHCEIMITTTIAPTTEGSYRMPLVSTYIISLPYIYINTPV